MAGRSCRPANITISAARPNGTAPPCCASPPTSSTPIPRSSASAGRSGFPSSKPYYDEAERLLHVNHFTNEPELQSVIDNIMASDSNWRVEPLPLGLKPEIVNDPQEAKHFDGYASVAGYKGGRRGDLHRADRE